MLVASKLSRLTVFVIWDRGLTSVKHLEDFIKYDKLENFNLLTQKSNTVQSCLRDTTCGLL